MKTKKSSIPSATRMAELLFTKEALEDEFRCSYAATSWEEETEVLSRIKTDLKAFFAYAKARQKNRARIFPFLPFILCTKP